MMHVRAIAFLVLLVAAMLLGFTGGCGSGIMQRVGFRGVPEQSEPPLEDTQTGDEESAKE